MKLDYTGTNALWHSKVGRILPGDKGVDVPDEFAKELLDQRPEQWKKSAGKGSSRSKGGK